jgi:hypothetical protein
MSSVFKARHDAEGVAYLPPGRAETNHKHRINGKGAHATSTPPWSVVQTRLVRQVVVSCLYVALLRPEVHINLSFASSEATKQCKHNF